MDMEHQSDEYVDPEWTAIDEGGILPSTMNNWDVNEPEGSFEFLHGSAEPAPKETEPMPYCGTTLDDLADVVVCQCKTLNDAHQTYDNHLGDSPGFLVEEDVAHHFDHSSYNHHSGVWATLRDPSDQMPDCPDILNSAGLVDSSPEGLRQRQTLVIPSYGSSGDWPWPDPALAAVRFRPDLGNNGRASDGVVPELARNRDELPDEQSVVHGRRIAWPSSAQPCLDDPRSRRPLYSNPSSPTTRERPIRAARSTVEPIEKRSPIPVAVGQEGAAPTDAQTIHKRGWTVDTRLWALREFGPARRASGHVSVVADGVPSTSRLYNLKSVWVPPDLVESSVKLIASNWSRIDWKGRAAGRFLHSETDDFVELQPFSIKASEVCSTHGNSDCLVLVEDEGRNGSRLFISVSCLHSIEADHRPVCVCRRCVEDPLVTVPVRAVRVRVVETSNAAIKWRDNSFWLGSGKAMRAVNESELRPLCRYHSDRVASDMKLFQAERALARLNDHLVGPKRRGRKPGSKPKNVTISSLSKLPSNAGVSSLPVVTESIINPACSTEGGFSTGPHPFACESPLVPWAAPLGASRVLLANGAVPPAESSNMSAEDRNDGHVGWAAEQVYHAWRPEQPEIGAFPGAQVLEDGFKSFAQPVDSRTSRLLYTSGAWLETACPDDTAKPDEENIDRPLSLALLAAASTVSGTKRTDDEADASTARLYPVQRVWVPTSSLEKTYQSLKMRAPSDDPKWAGPLAGIDWDRTEAGGTRLDQQAGELILLKVHSALECSAHSTASCLVLTDEIGQHDGTCLKLAVSCRDTIPPGHRPLSLCRACLEDPSDPLPVRATRLQAIGFSTGWSYRWVSAAKTFERYNRNDKKPIEVLENEMSPTCSYHHKQATARKKLQPGRRGRKKAHPTR